MRDRTNWLHLSALKPIIVSTQQLQCGQLTCPHYHPGQQWDGAELPTASSHLQLRHNQRGRCSGAWRAAWPSPGTEHLQDKVSSSSAWLFSLEHHVRLTGICAPSIIHCFTEMVANYFWEVRIEGISAWEGKLGACWAFRQQEPWEQSNLEAPSGLTGTELTALMCSYV